MVDKQNKQKDMAVFLAKNVLGVVNADQSYMLAFFY